MRGRSRLRPTMLLCASTLALCVLFGQLPATALAVAPQIDRATIPASPGGGGASAAAESEVAPITIEGPAAYVPVYRFYSRKSGSHVYTASEAEKADVQDTLSSTYSLDGVGYRIYASDPASTQPLHRFYNKKNGSHFYTASEAERASVVASLSAIYSYDGPAYDVSPEPAAGLRTVWRFYNKKNGSHFYTASDVERGDVADTLSETYTFEGPAFYLASRGTMTVETFGYSFGDPPGGCLFVADVRNVNAGAFSQDETGLMPSVRKRVMATPEAQVWLSVLRSEWLPVLKDGDKVAIGCARGHHRSVSMAVVFADDLRAEGYAVDLVHRDILKSW